jgi:hypothetical protein
MKKQTYSDVLCKAEAIVSDPKNRLSNGNLKAPVQKRVDKLVFKVAYLSQFATPESHYQY